MECSTPGFPVNHKLPELTQTHVHWVGDAIQPSHPLSSPCLASILWCSAYFIVQISIHTSAQFSCSVVSDSLRPHESQHARFPCPSPTPRVYPNLCPLSQWCHPTISSSVFPFSSCLQSFPASGSFPMSQFFESGGQSIRVSAST